MYAKIYVGKGFVYCENILQLACPNEFGGIGAIVVCPPRLEPDFWTGEIHLTGDVFTFSFGAVVKIEMRSTLREHDGGPWLPLWKKTTPFTYKNFEDGARLLRAALLM